MDPVPLAGADRDVAQPEAGLRAEPLRVLLHGPRGLTCFCWMSSAAASAENWWRGSVFWPWPSIPFPGEILSNGQMWGMNVRLYLPISFMVIASLFIAYRGHPWADPLVSGGMAHPCDLGLRQPASLGG